MADYTTLLQEENMAILKSNPFFEGLSDAQIAAFVRFADPEYMELEPEQTVSFVPGDRRKICVILSGKITVFTVDYSGRKTILRTHRNYGSVGTMQFMVNQYNLLYEIHAATEGKLALLYPEKVTVADEKLVAIQHKILFNLMHSQQQLFVTLSEHLLCLSQKCIRDKILRYLQIRSEEARAYEFDIPLSREDLAAYLAIDRASLSRSLGELRRDGVIDFRKNHFKILTTQFFKY